MLDHLKSRMFLFHHKKLFHYPAEKRKRMLNKIMRFYDEIDAFQEITVDVDEKIELMDKGAEEQWNREQKILNKQKELGLPVGIVEIEQRKEVTRFGRSVLHEAVLLDDLEQVIYLVENGANVSAKDNNGFTPLQLSICRGKKEITKYLRKVISNEEKPA